MRSNRLSVGDDNKLWGWEGDDYGQARLPSGGRPPAARPRPLRPCRRTVAGWRSSSATPIGSGPAARLDLGGAGSTRSAPARPFTEGPADRSPAWSRRTAGGSRTSRSPMTSPSTRTCGWPRSTGACRHGSATCPARSSQLAWAPDSSRIVVVCRVGVPDRDQGDRPGAQRAARRARPRGAPRRGRLAGRPAPPVPRRGRRRGSARQITRGEYDHDDPVVLARWRARRVRLRPQPAPRRPPIPERCVGDARRRRPAATAHERKGPRHLPGLLPGWQAGRVRGADHRTVRTRTTTCSSCPRTAAARPSRWRPTSTARSCSSPVSPAPLMLGRATGSC